MEVCNGIWNGRFFIWNGNGVEENYQCGIWKNRLPLHSIRCPDQRYVDSAKPKF